MAKKIGVTISVFFIIFMVFFCLGFMPTAGEKALFVVRKGENFSTVASRLEEQNLILSKKLFLLFVKLTNSQNKLKTGIYELSGRDGIFRILKQLKNNSRNFIRFTIPEGNNIKQTADIIADKVKIDKEKFIKIANDRNLEGYLMPETYFVSLGVSEEELIDMMYNEFNKKITPVMHERAKELNIPFKDIITMASIIEKEVVKPEERSIIAAVFYNRLKRKMMLQSCATVLYAMGVTKEKLSLEDTKFKSPYNTYLHFGLPPGPISNPGVESIKAALYPADSGVLYFVSAGDGSHFFAKTFSEHVKNKQIVKNRK
ncbi:endolytic transglycosylase MltG [Candidatus Endomicrobiellum devescovinae]|uniref:endolytic transglycosylase MltG n=1 Tax=Candidatus Endomicrobiellum devescovinae TaxID=3242322 RepID=UPI002836EE30|nr:endolytic transglycosylase MltG [Endomicrobium sp.]MDR1433671.1 endolytic transglycosylase MltG [Endomicrobium sp.]